MCVCLIGMVLGMHLPEKKRKKILLGENFKPKNLGEVKGKEIKVKQIVRKGAVN